jgi:hypothetical protein
MWESVLACYDGVKTPLSIRCLPHYFRG